MLLLGHMASFLAGWNAMGCVFPSLFRLQLFFLMPSASSTDVAAFTPGVVHGGLVLACTGASLLVH